jgi:DNA polymerase-4
LIHLFLLSAHPAEGKRITHSQRYSRLVKTLPRIILHIDMDAFFAAVEVLDKPHLKGKPVIVGGTTNRGVVSTASYEARKYGVHSAMPIYEAKTRCPEGTFLPVRKRRYAEFSRKVLDILRGFSPLVEQVSIDEAYLDITGTEALFGAPDEVARRIKETIRENIGLTCSIGVAPSKFLAKIASEMTKPDGLTIILGADVDKLLAHLPIEKIPGVGKRSAERLHLYGIKMVGDLRRFSAERLSRYFGKLGQRLHELVTGEQDSRVVVSRETKSMSSESTLDSNTKDRADLIRAVKHHAETVAERLRREKLRAGTITIKIKYGDFSLITRGHTIGKATDSTRAIVDAAVKLFMEEPLRSKVRLIGVAASNLEGSGNNIQMELFETRLAKGKERKVDEAVDKIRERFGSKVITRGEG